MNFQGISKIENYKFYLTVALKAAEDRTLVLKAKNDFKNKLEKSREIEAKKIRGIGKVISKSLIKIRNDYPKYSSLPDFYKELLLCYLNPKELDDSIEEIGRTINLVNEFTLKYSDKLSRTSDMQYINISRREYVGRLSSLLKKISKELMFLEEVRKLLKNLPVVKTGVKTISIVGFPNVGKTTLLTMLTPSKAEIASYSFTTKGLNIGYITYNTKKMQVIDTPGTLNRPERMNVIERQAYLAIKHLAEIVIYVFDLTESYPIKDQIKLYENIKRMDKPVVVYFSKADILEDEVMNEFLEKNKNIKEYYTDSEKLKEYLIENM